MADASAPKEEPEFLKPPPLPEDEFCIYATIHVDLEHADAFEADFAQVTGEAALDPGVLYFCISHDGDDPTVFHMFERWTGGEAHAKFHTRPLVRQIHAMDGFRDVKAKIVKPILPATTAS